MAPLHLLACSTLLLIAAIAAVANAAVDCGATLGSLPISGCKTCVEVTFNATYGGRDDRWSGNVEHGSRGGRGRRLLHGGPDGFEGGFEHYGALGPRPKCTECDPTGNYVLPTNQEGHYEHGRGGAGRCVCADGYGATSTGQVNATVRNATISFDQFTCAQCAAGQVPLGPKSGLIPAYNSSTQAWYLVLNTTVVGKRATRTATRLQRAAAKGISVRTSSYASTFMTAGLAFSGPRVEPAVRPPWTPGQCVECPVPVSKTTDGITCVAA